MKCSHTDLDLYEFIWYCYLVPPPPPPPNTHTPGELVYTVEDAVETMGFGFFQIIVTLFSGLLWVQCDLHLTCTCTVQPLFFGAFIILIVKSRLLCILGGTKYYPQCGYLWEEGKFSEWPV